MRLDPTQIEQTLKQFRAEVLAEDHPAVAQLNDAFGDHTFFLNERGLHVLELIQSPRVEPHSGEVISIADWIDETLTGLDERSGLRAHAPDPTGIVVLLKKMHS
jgi:hypothetical protein